MKNLKQWFYESSIDDAARGGHILMSAFLVLLFVSNIFSSFLINLIGYILSYYLLLKYYNYGLTNLQDELLGRYLKWTNEFLENEKIKNK